MVVDVTAREVDGGERRDMAKELNSSVRDVLTVTETDVAQRFTTAGQEKDKIIASRLNQQARLEKQTH